jgi:TonB family protein
MKKVMGWVLAFGLGCGVAVGQSKEAEISARLMGKPLQLRGFWMDDKLQFDASGTPSKTYKTGSFTESAFEAHKVELRGTHLEIEGSRMGLIFNRDEMDENNGAIFDRVSLGKQGKMETIRIQVDGDATGNFTKALDSIFATSLPELSPVVPVYWQSFFRNEVLHEKAASISTSTEKLYKIGGGVKPPRLLKSVDPSFSEAARGIKAPGRTLVSLIVDADGKPQNIEVTVPAGLGLDEQAVKAVSQYKFQPATLNGVPVRVSLSVDVNFQFFER